MALLLLFGWVTAFYVFIRLKKRRHPPLPPGPPADPIIGHLRSIPAENQEEVFYQWGKQYGDVIHVHALGKSIVVLNSLEAAIDLLDKRSGIYSDRPSFPLFDIMGLSKGTGFMQYGKVFRNHRRMFQQHLSASKCVAYQDDQTRETRALLRNILSNCKDREDHINRDVTLVKHLPSWFPGTYYAELARGKRKAITDMTRIPFEYVQDQRAKGTAAYSFVASELEERERLGPRHQNTDEDIMGVGMSIYIAGAETTWSTVSTLIYAMLLHPECQARAQHEIDSVVGPGRLPNFEDRKALPYVDAVIQEVTRAINLDENVYSEPYLFNPSRFLPRPEGNEEPRPFDNEAFGFGRRICPGRHLAEGSVWIAIASILATFNIKRAVREDGSEIIPDPNAPFRSGLASQPPIFECDMVPRSERAQRLILEDSLQASN
ncbi:hypothetical protein H0H92_014761 [Tricholoma furcatifolium]|nr:hypothetical protein H0H92_014761 [Tricholoma furcatifolium]